MRVIRYGLVSNHGYDVLSEKIWPPEWYELEKSVRISFVHSVRGSITRHRHDISLTPADLIQYFCVAKRSELLAAVKAGVAKSKVSANDAALLFLDVARQLLADEGATESSQTHQAVAASGNQLAASAVSTAGTCNA